MPKQPVDMQDIPAYRYATQRERMLSQPYVVAWKRQLLAIAAVKDWLLLAAILTRKDIHGKSWQDAMIVLRPPGDIAVMIVAIMTAKAPQSSLYPSIVEIGQWAEDLLIVPNAPTSRLGRWTRKLSY